MSYQQHIYLQSYYKNLLNGEEYFQYYRQPVKLLSVRNNKFKLLKELTHSVKALFTLFSQLNKIN